MTLKMLKVRVRLRPIEDGSAVAELVNRDDLINSLQQAINHEIHQEEPPPIKPYDPEEPQYSDAPPPPTSKDFEHLKAGFSDEERRRLRSVSRVPREITIPAKAVENDFAEDVIRGELTKLFPVCARVGIQVVIEP
jgi:hypothetical protein